MATVEGAADFEKSTLESVIQARASVGQINMGNLPNDPAAFARFQQAQDALSSALSRLMVVVERYPDIKANQNFRDLQVQLEGTENRIAVRITSYNVCYTKLLRIPVGSSSGDMAKFTHMPWVGDNELTRMPKRPQS